MNRRGVSEDIFTPTEQHAVRKSGIVFSPVDRAFYRNRMRRKTYTFYSNANERGLDTIAANGRVHYRAREPFPPQDGENVCEMDPSKRGRGRQRASHFRAYRSRSGPFTVVISTYAIVSITFENCVPVVCLRRRDIYFFLDDDNQQRAVRINILSSLYVGRRGHWRFVLWKLARAAITRERWQYRKTFIIIIIIRLCKR